MLAISDVHGAFDALRRVIGSGETVLILGDLANLTDYRTGEGAVASALGIDFARRTAAARGEGDFAEMRRMWREQAAGDSEAVRASIGQMIEDQYDEVSRALTGGSGYVMHGNVDRPDLLVKALPESFRYVHGERVEIEGLTFGFVGGGVATPLNAAGEVADADMEALLDGIGDVDVLCTHVAPAIDPLRIDVVTGRAERSSVPILRYLEEHRPRLHLFGDVHQPRASTWRIGPTLCINVGYFRATGRAHRLSIGQL